MKKVLAGILAVVIIFSGNAIRAQYTHDSSRLQQDYADYNQAFFNNELPKDTVVKWADIPKSKGFYIMGNTHADSASNEYEISIDTKSNVALVTADQTLLHEMCHVKTLKQAADAGQDAHGPLFKGCIVQLELQGAYTDLL